MSEPVDTLVKRSGYLFGKRNALLPFWQEICENFDPMRAQFTRQFYLSEQFADRLMTSYPLIVHRELKNTFSAMLRPRDLDWFEIRTDNYDQLPTSAKAFLQHLTATQRRAMYDRQAMFTRATKEADGDYAGLGNACISRDIDMRKMSLLYRCWHLKDVVWCERYDGTIGEVYRRWRPHAGELVKQFPETVSENVKRAAQKDPHTEIECLHAVIPGEDYDLIERTNERGRVKGRTPWASIYVECDAQGVLEELGSHSRIYTIPRWQTVSGSAFAYSPCAVAGLPDARLLQAMTLTLLEAGEMSVRPPLIATRDAVRSDLALYSGGVTWVDAEYDEKLGEALRPLNIDKSGLPAGKEMLADARNMLVEAFYLNKLSLPPPGREMTAYETGQRIQEWIRQAMPLFEPIESEYSAPLLDDTFEGLLRTGAFGPFAAFPRELRRQSVRFRLESPLHQATERKKGALLLQAGQMLSQAVQLDPACADQMNAVTALRDALDGIGVPAAWMRGEDEAAAISQQKQQQAAATMRTQQVTNAAQAAESLGRASQAMGGGTPGASP